MPDRHRQSARSRAPLVRKAGIDRAATAAARGAAMRRRRPIWLVGNATAAILGVVVLATPLPLMVCLGWATGVIALCALTATGERIGIFRGAPEWRNADTAGGLLLGFAWGTATVLVIGSHSHTQNIGILALEAAAPAAAALLLAPAPLGGLALIVATGAAGIAGGLHAGDPAFAVVALGYAVACATLLLCGARALVRGHAIEAELADKREMVSLLLHEFEDGGGDWLWRTDKGRCLVDVSPQFAAQFGASPAEIEGTALVALFAGEDWESGNIGTGLRDLADRLLRRESFRDLVVPVRIGGDLRWWSLSATTRRDAGNGGAGFWGVATDVTERHRNAERLGRMARFDALTGLANRPHVIESLGDALRQGHRFGRRSTLMLVDLDRFKQINDTLGHPVGDRLLMEVSDRLRRLVGDDGLCGRLGGDEFAVVIADANDRDHVEAIAETIVTSLSAPYDIDGNRLHIGASVGTATAPRDGRAVETMLRNADLALYRAKDDGRGVHRRYEPQLHAAADERRRIEAALREALERGQLRLVYQPIVDARDGRLAAYEALLRWTHPELGPISPSIFIPIAEEARLIGRIGDWVIHTACRDAIGWRDDIRVAVNLSAAQLKDPQLAATIVSALSHSGLAADRLELEIAESVFLREGGATADAVDRVLALGVRVSLDDFGTSRSSFGYLRKGRFSTIKIDRSFVRGVNANAPESIAIVRAIVAIADGLGMSTIAEGAETRAEYDRMQRLGCAHIQGWLVGQPIDAAEAGTLAEQRDAGRRVA